MVRLVDNELYYRFAQLISFHLFNCAVNLIISQSISVIDKHCINHVEMCVCMSVRLCAYVCMHVQYMYDI